MPSDAERMLNYYLDEGGNFIETAISYGDSEKKIGQVMKTRRDECFLSTKTHFRTKKEAADGIDAVSYTHLDVYKRQKSTCPMRSRSGIFSMNIKCGRK